jgi:DNA-binding transcriptional regulator YiaG
MALRKSSEQDAMTAADILALRERLGETQNHMAALLGVRPSTWRRWEYGWRGMPIPVQRLLTIVERLPAARKLLERMADESESNQC